jgi:hypothetical protein
MGPPTTGGSINELGWCFHPLGISDLAMVDQTGASWNRIVTFL